MNFKFLIYLFILFNFELINCKKSQEVLRIQFKNEKQRDILDKFKTNYSNLINYENLNENTVITSNIDSQTSLTLKNYLYDNRIKFVEIKNKSPRSKSIQPLKYENKHMEYKEILKMLIKWKNIKQKEYKNKIEIYEIGRTIKNRPIVVAKITDQVNLDDSKKKSIFIESGIHAREWLSIDTSLYIMNSLIFDSYYKDVLKKFVFYFLIVANPGYIYTWTTNRVWRKNLKEGKKSCMGVDLNRNFDVNFGLINNFYCAEDYKGTKPFSEKESQAERDYITELIQSGNKIDLFLAFHSYGQQICYPFGFTSNKISNWKESNNLLKKVTKNLKSYQNVDYSYGQTYHVIYPASGGSDDWVASNNYSRFTFVMEMRDKGTYGFFIPEEKIEEAALDGVVVLNTILNYLSPNIVKIKPGN